MEPRPRERAAALEAGAGTLSQAHGMRGDEGDLAKALELGDHALEIWPPGEQPIELAEHYHLQADVHYWTGSYERALAFTDLSAATGGLDPAGAEFRVRGSGMRR